MNLDRRVDDRFPASARCGVHLCHPHTVQNHPRSVHELRTEVRCFEIASAIACKGACFPVRHDAAVWENRSSSLAVDAGSHAGATEKIEIALIITAEPALCEACGVQGRECKMIVPINLYAGPATICKSACSGAEPSWTDGLIRQSASNRRRKTGRLSASAETTPQRSKQQRMAGVHFSCLSESTPVH